MTESALSRPSPARSRFANRERGSDEHRGGEAPRRPGRRGDRFGRREPVFADNETIDYKDIARLRRCLDERGRILPRRRLRHSAHVHRRVTVAVKRARHVALLPFVARDGRP